MYQAKLCENWKFKQLSSMQYPMHLSLKWEVSFSFYTNVFTSTHLFCTLIFPISKWIQWTFNETIYNIVVLQMYMRVTSNAFNLTGSIRKSWTFCTVIPNLSSMSISSGFMPSSSFQLIELINGCNRNVSFYYCLYLVPQLVYLCQWLTPIHLLLLT